LLLLLLLLLSLMTIFARNRFAEQGGCCWSTRTSFNAATAFSDTSRIGCSLEKPGRKGVVRAASTDPPATTAACSPFSGAVDVDVDVNVSSPEQQRASQHRMPKNEANHSDTTASPQTRPAQVLPQTRTTFSPPWYRSSDNRTTRSLHPGADTVMVPASRSMTGETRPSFGHFWRRRAVPDVSTIANSRSCFSFPPEDRTSGHLGARCAAQLFMGKR